MRDEENDDVWGLKDDEHSLEFTFNRNIRMERFSLYFDKN